MTSTNNEKNEVLLDAAVATEGKAVAAEWAKRDKADKSRLTRDITRKDGEPAGLVIRTGELMVALRDATVKAGGERITSGTLRQAGLADMPSQRRSECLWFVENEAELLRFINAEGEFAMIDGKQQAKRKFTSVTAMQAAHRKVVKAIKLVEGAANDDGDKPNVGANSEAEGDEGGSVTPEAPVKPSDLKLAAQNALSAIEDDATFAAIVTAALLERDDASKLLALINTHVAAGTATAQQKAA